MQGCTYWVSYGTVSCRIIGTILMIIHKGGWVHNLLHSLSRRAEQAEKDRLMLEEALEHAHEGLIIS